MFDFTLSRRFLLVLPALLLPGVASAAPVPAPLRGVRRIVTLGDSITQGGARPGGYVWLMDRYLKALYPQHPIEIINAGISGHKSSDMLARFQQDVLDRKPDLVTISVGVNDVWHGFTREHPAGYGPRRVPPEQYETNVRKMIEMARAAGVRVLLFTTTIFEDEPHSPRNSRALLYNDILRRLAREYGLRLADQYGAFARAWQAREGTPLTSDQVHMAPSGDRLMARTALRALGITAAALDSVEAGVRGSIPARP